MNEQKKIIVKSDNIALVSETQLRLVQLAADDIPRKDIAKELNLSPRTIEMYYDKIRHKFDCNTIPGLVALFFRNGLIK